MKTLPLFFYPSTLAWVDDDKVLLNAMARVFDKENQVLTFQSAEECLTYFKEYHSPLSTHDFLINLNDTLKNQGADAGIASIATLRNDSKRHTEITALVIDYNMPNMNGLELTKHMQALCMPKILLTGNTPDPALTEEARQHSINRFVQKSAPDMLSKLSTYLRTLSCEYFQTITSTSLSLLEAQGKLPLSDPTFIDFFETHCKTNNIMEYYLIDRQGSFLCIDSQGASSYLAVHTHESINTWLSIYDKNNHLSSDALRAITEHTKIPFNTHAKLPQLYDTQTLEGRQKYFWAIIS